LFVAGKYRVNEIFTKEMKMKMCKYCGGIVKDGCGPRGVYCSKKCWTAVSGFDKGLESERKKGKISVDAMHDAKFDMSDAGAGARAIYDNADKSFENMIMKAKDIHPLLPSALLLIADGKTQTEAARAVGMKQSYLSELIKNLQNSL
jgi:hypothetical protein